jgi:transketolase
MVSLGAGFAKTLKTTSILYTITPFLTSRVHDQLRVDVAYMRSPLIVCSVGGGFAYDMLGFTHFGLDDLALIGALPNFRILTPSEPDDVTELIDRLLSNQAVEAPYYLRLQKGGEPSLTKIFTDYHDRPAYRYWPGTDVEIITHGAITEEALKAREFLKNKVSIGVRSVIDWHLWLNNKKQDFSGVDQTILLEEHRNTGLLAHHLANVKLLPDNATILCVTNSEFENCLSRTSALKLNKIDSASISELILNMDI